MLLPTKAIVLHKTNYSESSIVVQVFTLEFGKVGLLVQGVKKRKSRTKSALFEPLSLIEIVANFSDTQKLIRPREVKLHTPFISIQTDMTKRMLAIFLSEVLHKSIKVPHPDIEMFNYVENALVFLENAKGNTANFHISFLLELSKHLGFYPQKMEGDYFDMLEGNCTNSIPQSNRYLQGEEKDLFLYALGINIDESARMNFTSLQRKTVLISVIKYYQTHISGLGEIKSHVVLESIFS